MVNFPAAGYVSDSSRIESEMKTSFENWLAATKQLAGGVAESTLTLSSSGQATPSSYFHSIETNGGVSAQTLNQLLQTNLPDGSLLFIYQATAGHVVTVAHHAGGAGEVYLGDGQNAVLTNIVLVLRRMALTWGEAGRFYYAGGHAADGGLSMRNFYALAGLGQNTFTGRQEWKRGADIASAATLTPGTDGNWFWVTGTTTIANIAPMPPGTRIVLGFASAVSLTHSATFFLAGQTSRTVRAGSSTEFVSVASGYWYELGGAGGGAGGVLAEANPNHYIPQFGAEASCWGATVPGGTLGTANAVRFTATGYVLSGSASPASTDSCVVFKLYYGSALVANFILGINGLPNATAFRLEAIVSGWGATNAQLAWMDVSASVKVWIPTGSAAFPLGMMSGGGCYDAGYFGNPGRGSGAIDSTVDQWLQLNAFSPVAGDAAVEHAILEKV